MGKRNDFGEWLVIVNPNAGKRKGLRDWSVISGLLESNGIKYNALFTEGRHHATTLTSDSIRAGYRKIIVAGGDGTMNEVVNGIFMQKECSTIEITLGMITVGTGNDWGKMFNIPKDYEKAILAIKNGNSILQDAGVVHYQSVQERESRYFVNIAGLGFDATVVRRANIQKDKGKSGKSSYYMALLKSLFLYKTTHTKVIVDNHETTNDTFSISLGIGKYSGGGMIQTPEAKLDDGLFDVTIIKRMRKGEIIRSLKKLFDGTILDHPKIKSYKGKDIKIDSDPVIHLEVDGESLGHSPINFEIIPRSVKVIYQEL